MFLSDRRMKNSRNEEQALWRGRVGIYTHGVPVAVHAKMKRDKGLFDDIYIASPNAALFDSVKQMVPLTDPLLIGRIGPRLYLGATWGLKADLAAQEAQERRVTA